MSDPRIDSRAILAAQAARVRQVEDARAQFVDELADIVAIAIQAGVQPAEVRADIDACLSVNADFNDETERNCGDCPGCGFNVDHDDHQCCGATEEQIRAAVAALMTSTPKSYWGQGDTDNLMVQTDGTFVSPQSFGGTFSGSVRRDDSAVVGAEGQWFVVMLDADEDEDIPETVKVVAL